jgi:predicted dehydrogenase
MSPSPLGFAIVGTGEAARAHAAALRDCGGARLVACLSRRPDAAARFAADAGCRGETDLDAVLNDDSVAAVIVATEPARHEVAIPVARAARHVLIEKPLAASWDGAIAIAEACRDAKVTASVVSQRRFEAGFEAVRSALGAGAIGAPVFAEFTHLASRPDEYFASGNGWRRGCEGGITMNLLIHEIDRLLCLFGRVRSVQATLAPSPAAGRPDRRATLLLGFERGIQAVVRGTTELGKTWGQTLGIFGEKGKLLMENGAVKLVPHPLGVEGRLARARQLAIDLLPGGGAASPHAGRAPLARQIEDFVRAIGRREQASVTLEGGLAALRVVKAAHESDATGRTVLLAHQATG